MNLTQEDIKNLLILIAKAPLVGSEALVVAVLQNKLQAMIESPQGEQKEEKVEKKK